MSTTLIAPDPVREEARYLIEQARAPKLRTMREFAEQEIVLPRDGGPFEGQRFRINRQPFTGLWLDEVDRGKWPRFASVGPTQSGKTLLCFAICVLYHLFEVRETVIPGVPDMNIADDKWTKDLRPVIESAPNLARFLPERGQGSKGGRVKTGVTFRNGATMRFMSGASRDVGRASFTSRVLAVTETDAFDESSETSREADKLTQLEGRCRARTLMQRRIYLECTATIETGRIWKEWAGGTASRIVLPCPLCQAWVSPEREHLKGWQGAETDEEAYHKSYFTCPECEKPWSEADRRKANLGGVLVHKGQEVTPNGQVVGPDPSTLTFGFRWSAVNNMLLTAGDIGFDEWDARRATDRENAEKKLCQQVWAIPYEPPIVELIPLDREAVKKRTTKLKRGVVPQHCAGISVGVDTGKRRLHWLASAWCPGRPSHIVEYGEHPVDSAKLGTREGLLQALRALVPYWVWRDESGQEWRPAQVWIDSGYHEHTEGVYAFCAGANQGREMGAEWCRPTKGHGAGQQFAGRYSGPTQLSKQIRYLGREYHFAIQRNSRTILVHVNADHWKSAAHEALARPEGEPGALVLWDGPPDEHDEFADQVTAERPIEEFKEGKGSYIWWEVLRRKNHYLDALYASVAAGHFVMTEAAKPQPQRGTDKWWSRRERQRRAR
jgi:phage terminase large subunit GpA-like protein